MDMILKVNYGNGSTSEKIFCSIWLNFYPFLLLRFPPPQSQILRPCTPFSWPWDKKRRVRMVHNSQPSWYSSYLLLHWFHSPLWTSSAVNWRATRQLTRAEFEFQLHQVLLSVYFGASWDFSCLLGFLSNSIKFVHQIKRLDKTNAFKTFLNANSEKFFRYLH